MSSKWRAFIAVVSGLSTVLFLAAVVAWLTSYSAGILAGVRCGNVLVEVATVPGSLGLTFATIDGPDDPWLQSWFNSFRWGTTTEDGVTMTYTPRTLGRTIAGFGGGKRVSTDFAGNHITAYAILLPGWFAALVLGILPFKLAWELVVRVRRRGLGRSAKVPERGFEVM